MSTSVQTAHTNVMQMLCAITQRDLTNAAASLDTLEMAEIVLVVIISVLKYICCDINTRKKYCEQMVMNKLMFLFRGLRNIFI